MKQSHKSVLKFALTILLSGCFGAVLSVLLLSGGDALSGVFSALAGGLYRFYLPIQLLVSLVLGVGVLVCCRRGKALSTGSEEEELFEEGDRWIGRAMLCTNLSVILSITLYGAFVAGIYGLPRRDAAYVLLSTGVFLAVQLLTVFAEVRLVNLVKLRNPEKKGDPLGFRFQKDWEGSCDEAELMGVYRASYQSFKALRWALMAAMLLGIFAGAFFGAGPLPVLLVGFLWGVHTLTYTLASLRRPDRTNA